ncbi:Hypothetical protein LUCI_3475 [Lucifera butyrica]|uniref:Uncharacterized protein n=1 Tax=Lucifera butyrica TaxID=1351585 RepID=A0A498R639_9FIRM|nr:Hypothetical protein LUCI_3475 [Lucifera butyrica]
MLLLGFIYGLIFVAVLTAGLIVCKYFDLL